MIQSAFCPLVAHAKTFLRLSPRMILPEAVASLE